MSKLPFDWPKQPNPPERPTIQDDDVVRLAARNAVRRIADEWEDDEITADDTIVIQELYEAFSRNYDDDGYTLARRLETIFCWSPDAALVEILDHDFLHRARDEAVKQWVNVYGIKPELSIGTEVVCRHGIGVITEIAENAAEYVVQIGDKKFIVEYEGVTLP